MTVGELKKALEQFDDRRVAVITLVETNDSYEVNLVAEQSRPYLDTEDEEQWDKVVTIE